MSFSRVNTRLLRGLFCLGTLLLLAWRIPVVTQSFSSNSAAVNTTSLCAQPHTFGDNYRQKMGALEGELSWFQAVQARCSGDSDRTLSASRDALEWSDTRLDLIQTIAPDSGSLAQLAVTKYPNNAAAHFWLAATLSSHEDAEAEIWHYEQGLALDKTNADAWQELGRLYEARYDLKSAADAHDKACYYVDHGKNGCGAAARLQMVLGQYEKALLSYERIVEQVPYYSAYIKLKPVSEFLKAGRNEEAISYLRYLIAHGVAEAAPMLTVLVNK